MWFDRCSKAGSTITYSASPRESCYQLAWMISTGFVHDFCGDHLFYNTSFVVCYSREALSTWHMNALEQRVESANERLAEEHYELTLLRKTFPVWQKWAIDHLLKKESTRQQVQEAEEQLERGK